jgi:hypothetical protein
MQAPDPSYLFIAEADAKAQAERLKYADSMNGDPVDLGSKILACKAWKQYLIMAHANNTISVFDVEVGHS